MLQEADTERYLGALRFTIDLRAGMSVVRASIMKALTDGAGPDARRAFTKCCLGVVTKQHPLGRSVLCRIDLRVR